MNIGVIGCGVISAHYLEAQKRFPQLTFTKLADLDSNRARQLAQQFGTEAADSPEALLADPEIDVVLNLTIPSAHAEVDLQVLAAGKHVYTEKPLATGLDDARRILKKAKKENLRVGSAPDTFLGAAHQTSRKLLDDGEIGLPIGASAFMLMPGPEVRHPRPDFFYQPGAGPLMDRGPYHITTLINLFGPVRRVCAFGRRPFDTRRVLNGPDSGREFNVDVDTFVSGLIEFHSGMICSLTLCFGAQAAALPHHIEIYGSEGTLLVPDPNQFGLPIYLQRKDAEQQEIPQTHIYAEPSRSVGLADMVDAINKERPHRCSGELAYHTLEILLGIQLAATTGTYVTINSLTERPRPMDTELLDGEI